MVYFLVLIEQDQAVRPAVYAEYIAQVRPIVERYGGRYLVRTDQVIPMQEGDCPDRMILIEWDSRERLEACFSSDEYRRIRKKREHSVRSRAMIVEGVQ